jgi:hypothetical protein
MWGSSIVASFAGIQKLLTAEIAEKLQKKTLRKTTAADEKLGLRGDSRPRLS